MKTKMDSVRERIGIIDLARFYAMALVFYGHFIEEFMLLKNPVGAVQYKFIYSFHMVLFIVLAGYVVKEQDSEMGVGKFLKQRFLSRIVPFIFFTILMMVPTIFLDGKFFGLVLPSAEGYAKGLLWTAFGIPSFCIPSWFLLLIIGVELVHYSIFRFLKESNSRLLIAGVAFYVVGYLLNLKLDIFNPLKGRVVGWNYFYIHEAITLYAFYLMGIYIRRKRFLDKVSARILAPGAVVAFMVVLFTYQLNTGPFNFSIYNYVVIMFASHGHMFFFPLTAIAGCALILFLAKITPGQKTMVWLGQNTLILMCLNGIFYHYINPGLAKWVLDNLSGSAMMVSTIGVIVTLASLSLCIPFVFVFRYYVVKLMSFFVALEEIAIFFEVAGCCGLPSNVETYT
ncbi:MAG: acyltransferase family protein [Proteobacteria bacterium]|nr:acyltransferase family protein [Pseudomonadota bacterium]MBU1697945.1 acyltransferase family protein [Pseudomonadota bacterium]